MCETNVGSDTIIIKAKENYIIKEYLNSNKEVKCWLYSCERYVIQFWDWVGKERQRQIKYMLEESI